MNEAELLFTEILDCDRAHLYLKKDLPLNKDKVSLISSVFKRRVLGEPLPYILGKTEFMGLEFKVTKDVLIPRQETEVLVETVLKIMYGVQSTGYSAKILDLGTGSGCIAVSLAKHLPQCQIDALDISDGALAVARENAKLNQVKVNFIQSDLFHNTHLGPSAYDIIVSNPPYVASQDLKQLQVEISYEPSCALDAGKDGLDFYKRIINESPKYLKPEGLLILEIGFRQRFFIEKILQDSGVFKIIELIPDYNNIERVIVAKKYG
ncbi:MAG: protein-(glutamine-N5) methyltransferase, release factor-specific [Omnitrophica WOR_2 bacterium RBG_13_41_10]|nr:MAG: protein-(glutamine-N5) methyltransferase, release factor-specific [Omnitrophica WOR_2 bacterium RBG_13_41_10]